jgi:hypothetical protein
VLLALALWPAIAAATPPSYYGGQYRYWAFSNHNDLRDVLAYWVPGPFHVQLEYWDFVDPGTDDQFRPEVGIHLRDARRSVYTLQWRHERLQERFWLMTDQVLSNHVVGRLEVSPIVTSGHVAGATPSGGRRDSTEWVFAAGADYYWGSYNFASATVIRDPRGEEDGLWVVPLRVRLANERNDWVQATVAPASRRTLGWAFDLKEKWLRLGVERNNRYDFTSLDNVIYTVGFEVPLSKPE